MTFRSIKAGDLKPGDVLLNTSEYFTVVHTQRMPREPKLVQVTLHSRHGKEILLFLGRDAPLEVRRP